MSDALALERDVPALGDGPAIGDIPSIREAGPMREAAVIREVSGTRDASALAGARAIRDSSAWAAPLLLAAMVGGLVAGRFETGAFCLGLAAAISFAIGAPWPGRRLWTTLSVGLGLALLCNALLMPGHAFWRGPFGARATWEGLDRGALLGLRLFAASLAIHGLRTAWPGERAADEIARGLAPLERLRVPVSASRTIAGLALRFAPMLAAEARRIAALQALRAGGPPRGLRQRLARQRAALVPTLVSALERADRVALALEARHYRARPIGRGAPSPWWGLALAVAIVGVALLWRS